MEEYGIDGVFMQRFICDMKRKNIRAHFDHVLDCAMTSADKHHRAIAIMYDLSGMRSEDVDFLLEDIDGIDKSTTYTTVIKTIPIYITMESR